MKFRSILLLFAFVMIMAACNVGHEADNDRTLDEVVRAMKAEGLTPIDKGEADSDALAQVKPRLFAISAPNEDAANAESVYVYQFDSNQDLKEAIKQQHYTVTTLTAIKNYEKQNVLVVYFATGGKIEKFGGKIQSAIDGL
ncbi:hypothetical protein PaecuDRAFT_4604 [Paenibacillus curdlanolyticus YK9]|uniref:Lipoprotein n=1 Tax=Paenibacillus curdlanolyticus YK9 TaxID=717606 RepID=E0IG13_9BACL|nr:hypothetical protein [Paenibacillus curdlanolyticus]EFM08593.1 hypothetical protein PaecuDRAFT_4604 [Paenibacillus curdlanolyticus YK9]